MPSRHTPLRVAFASPIPGTRRGKKLLFLSTILALKGVGYLSGNITNSTEVALRVISAHVDLRIIGGMVVALCLVAAFTAYCHHGRDRYGYMILAGLSGAWCGSFLVGPGFGAPTSALQGALSYALIGAFILMCAGDDEIGSREAKCEPSRGRVRARCWRLIARITR